MNAVDTFNVFALTALRGFCIFIGVKATSNFAHQCWLHKADFK